LTQRVYISGIKKRYKRINMLQTKYFPNQPFIAHRDAVIGLINHQTEARVDLIEQELTNGYNLINKYNYTVTVFGSARSTSTSVAYHQARELAGKLSKEGFAIVTGGGRGIMEAANRGAFESGGKSVGLNIKLPHEQVLNSYTTDSMAFHYFFARKVILIYASSALVCFPGGFGTLDELTEAITLVQTGKMPSLPIILVGSQYWGALDGFVREFLLKGDLISPGDEALYHITDDLDEIVQIITYHRDATSSLATVEAKI